MSSGTQASSDRDHWNRRYLDRPWPGEPARWLVDNATLLPEPGAALDLAGGTGRNAIWLAQHGWNVTIIDVSDVALELAETRARSHEVTIATEHCDLTADGLPDGPWDLIMVFHYLDRSLFPAIETALRPGGVLIGCLATVVNLERNERPPLPYLLNENELPDLVTGFDLVRYEESWRDGHHDARFVARRPQPD